MLNIDRVGDVSVAWGESLRWDERRQRLYFVDCAAQTLHWLEHGEPPLHSLTMPSMPTGVVLADDGMLVVALDGGLHVVDVDAAKTKLLVSYPPGLGERANDAAADLDGNLVTGTLNLVPGPGSYWWYSVTHGWRQLDDGITNANGPVVIDVAGESTLVFADTPAQAVYAYPYDGRQGTVGERRMFGDHAALDGVPDGATADAEGGVWSCSLGNGKIARFTAAGLDRVLDMPMTNPSDVTFGGPDLDRLFVTSIALRLGQHVPPATEAGWLLAVDGLGVPGRPEPRFRL
jgi:sugar lactone lactonase YvrE